jgi:glycerol-3-phosphate dehydrogenase
MKFNSEQARAGRAEELSAGVLDVLVVGGGIVGAGVARDAAMRGLHVGLVEQYDFASGTSSRTSRLLHGGLRYLAQGRLGLVYQASREKRALHRIAAHLAEPLAFVFPTYRGSGWPLWKLRIGVKLYDWLCSGRNLGPSSAMGRQPTLTLLPGLFDQSLTGAVRYFDGLTNDARLVFDTLRSAANHGAIVTNYCRLEDASPGPSGWTCRARDTESGRSLEIHSRSVANATGPWGAKLPHSRLHLRLTKGVHLVIARSRLPVSDAVVMTDDRRLLFAIPWGERVILGTTDTDYDGPIESVRTEPADTEYILRIVNRSFPAAGLTPADVLSDWAGVRPLLADSRGGPSDISRAHHIAMAEPGWIDVAGGKLTTYRLIAEETVDRLVRFLGLKGRRSTTAEGSLIAATDAGRASAVVPPEPSPELVEHYCTREWSVHLDDVMIRRTSWHHYVPDRSTEADQVAGWMAEVLGWSQDRLAAERVRYREAFT